MLFNLPCQQIRNLKALKNGDEIYFYVDDYYYHFLFLFFLGGEGAYNIMPKKIHDSTVVRVMIKATTISTSHQYLFHTI